jgi:hypothetical protein
MLGLPLTLKMKVVFSSETSVNFYQTIRRQTLENNNLCSVISFVPVDLYLQ